VRSVYALQCPAINFVKTSVAWQSDSKPCADKVRLDSVALVACLHKAVWAGRLLSVLCAELCCAVQRGWCCILPGLCLAVCC